VLTRKAGASGTRRWGGKRAGSLFPAPLPIRLDGTGNVSLTPDEGDHSVQLSPSGKFIVDTYSTPEAPPVVVLRDQDGKVILLWKKPTSRSSSPPLETAIPITVKARDGKTDLYGLMFRPASLDPSRKYPIINMPIRDRNRKHRIAVVRGGARRPPGACRTGLRVVTIDGMGLRPLEVLP